MERHNCLGNSFIALVIVGVVALFVSVGVSLYQDHVDTEGAPMIDGIGTVVDRSYTPGRWQPVPVGRTMSGYYVPASYRVRVEYDGWTGSASVSSTFYESVSVGQNIPVRYQIGHSGTHYLRDVY